MDPLCGWCYGNSKHTLALFEAYNDRLDFVIIPGGMWAGPNVRMQSPQMAGYFLKHDERIAQLTGTEFGEAYFQFIHQHEVKLDSETPSRAIVTVQKFWNDRNIPFMVAVQQARYRDGKDLNMENTYLEICAELGIDSAEFIIHFNSEEMKASTQATFATAIQYASSYPTLLFEEQGQLTLLEQGYSSLTEITKHIDRLIDETQTNLI
ncbi:protein-disulfide isomerase [Pedobacter lusitanus]|uniref:Contig51, whole genome shotgun sequence n=2 Tax=Pedobacter lusitanus TaxID=1503925 RepID=A0A0D0F5T1_9SPHI|nr:protein-disulfide isomerase [Pedobacter lusitanus]